MTKFASLRTPLCDLLGCDVPILLAGMGGVSRWELAAAVAEAGGYAMLGMVREDPALIEREVKALRAATSRRFAVNVIPAATNPQLLDRQIDLCIDLGQTLHVFLGRYARFDHPGKETGLPGAPPGRNRRCSAAGRGCRR